jgi:hypothetical protein
MEVHPRSVCIPLLLTHDLVSKTQPATLKGAVARSGRRSLNDGGPAANLVTPELRAGWLNGERGGPKSESKGKHSKQAILMQPCKRGFAQMNSKLLVACFRCTLCSDNQVPSVVLS